ncbi:UNVERIFIED_CONTAM: hypothetical protein FKN15_072653 [Acipenser sinensis]
MLRRWFVETEGAVQAYQWDSNKVVVEWLEKHLKEEDGTRSTIRENIKYLKRDYALKHIRRSGTRRITFNPVPDQGWR